MTVVTRDQEEAAGTEQLAWVAPVEEHFSCSPWAGPAPRARDALAPASAVEAAVEAGLTCETERLERGPPWDPAHEESSRTVSAKRIGPTERARARGRGRVERVECVRSVTGFARAVKGSALMSCTNPQ